MVFQGFLSPIMRHCWLVADFFVHKVTRLGILLINLLASKVLLNQATSGATPCCLRRYLPTQSGLA